ncbi:MAG: hypothetical protein IPH60_08485 [Flavobacteriales bacterium]|nr:hypothetical protein [Flavobacteriales bacterium]
MLQQKEWFSDYVFEDIAADLLVKDAALKAAFEAKRNADPAFAKDDWAQTFTSSTSGRRISNRTTDAIRWCALRS